MPSTPESVPKNSNGISVDEQFKQDIKFIREYLENKGLNQSMITRMVGRARKNTNIARAYASYKEICDGYKEVSTSEVIKSFAKKFGVTVALIEGILVREDIEIKRHKKTPPKSVYIPKKQVGIQDTKQNTGKNIEPEKTKTKTNEPNPSNGDMKLFSFESSKSFGGRRS